jgi:thiol-disulfide isomerase/thioredoxin
MTAHRKEAVVANTRAHNGSRFRIPRGRWTWGALVAIVVVAVITFFAATGSGQDELDGPPAPEVVLEGFDGGTVRLADFAGQPLVVNFWASWCVPCLAELPGFERVHQQHKGEVAFLGVNLADDPGAAEAVVEQTGISYPVARDPDGSAFEAFQAFGMPTTVFISPEGAIVELYTGELSAEALAERIDRYFSDL